MGAGGKCKACGASTLEVDPSRGDTVCTTCGTVLEDSVIVSEVQFEEKGHGMSTAIGHFVSSESSGGCRGFGNGFHAGVSRESREITLQNAKKAIANLCQNVRLNQHCLDTAFNFYKMAFNRQLTRGRKLTHIVAACVYMTCRIEGTPHLLIDFSDVLQICAFELGRTYVKVSQALCINIPSADPCLYVLRFANKLELGDKTHEVTMTALRLVQRMKRDNIHYGRRPSGVCGAALLMAARLHSFSRTVGDIVKVVQVHETTLRKRLVEFGETPSSSLSLAEFMSVDLEEEQDPPSYKAARAKDRQRLQDLVEDKASLKQFNHLKAEIEKHIFDRRKRKSSTADDELDEFHSVLNEDDDLKNFVADSTFDLLEDIEEEETLRESVELGPNLKLMGLGEVEGTQLDAKVPVVEFKYEADNGELDLEGIDDDEIDGYLMSEADAAGKGQLWNRMNADYLKAKEEKEERLRKEAAEGKGPPDKKKRKKKKTAGVASSAGEAIEKMLQEKKISSKINYDVLKSLNILKTEVNDSQHDVKAEIVTKEDVLSGLVETSSTSPIPSTSHVPTTSSTTKPTKAEPTKDEAELEDDEEPDEPPADDVMSMAQMLNRHNDDDADDYDYDDDY